MNRSLKQVWKELYVPKAILLALFFFISNIQLDAHSPIENRLDNHNPNTETSLELASFQGKTVKMGNHLVWKVSNLISRKDFEIQRSSDGLHWNNIGTISIASSSIYEMIDMQPFNGVNYYRIKQVDAVGRVYYSSIIKMSW